MTLTSFFFWAHSICAVSIARHRPVSVGQYGCQGWHLSFRLHTNNYSLITFNRAVSNITVILEGNKLQVIQLTSISMWLKWSKLLDWDPCLLSTLMLATQLRSKINGVMELSSSYTKHEYTQTQGLEGPDQWYFNLSSQYDMALWIREGGTKVMITRFINKFYKILA